MSYLMEGAGTGNINHTGSGMLTSATSYQTDTSGESLLSQSVTSYGVGQISSVYEGQAMYSTYVGNFSEQPLSSASHMEEEEYFDYMTGTYVKNLEGNAQGDSAVQNDVHLGYDIESKLGYLYETGGSAKVSEFNQVEGMYVNPLELADVQDAGLSTGSGFTENTLNGISDDVFSGYRSTLWEGIFNSPILRAVSVYAEGERTLWAPCYGFCGDGVSTTPGQEGPGGSNQSGMWQPRKYPLEWHPEVWNGQKIYGSE